MTVPADADPTSEIMWAHPASRNNPSLADTLLTRLDFYETSIQLTAFAEGVPARSRTVSPADIAETLTANTRTHTGLLPDSTLWKTLTPGGRSETAIWTPPRKRRVAVVLEYNEPTRRFTIPMPGIIFVCRPSQPPRIFTAKERPTSEDQHIYHCPVFNAFDNGETCQGTHKYPEDISLIPEQFFHSWFTLHGNSQRRSLKHPNSLMDLWAELDGQEEYPLDDLVYWGTVRKAMDRT